MRRRAGPGIGRAPAQGRRASRTRGCPLGHPRFHFRRNAVSDEIDRLWALKGLDERLVEARSALARFPEQKRALETRAADERRKLEGLQTRIADAQKRRRELERDVESATEQERKFSAQLPMVKKNE